jgi:hypothetical protein
MENLHFDHLQLLNLNSNPKTSIDNLYIAQVPDGWDNYSLAYPTTQTYDWGKLVVNYKWTGWVWEITGLKLKTVRKLPIILEEFIEYTPI